MASVVIRLVRDQADLRATEWEGQYTHLRRVYATAYRLMQRGDAALWVAEAPEGRLVGQAFVLFRSLRPELADGHSRGYIFAVRVRPSWRSQGIGTALMDRAEADLARRGFRWATLLVARTNRRALAFYRRRGYRVVAADPGTWSYVDPHGHLRHVVEPSWRLEKRLLLEDP